MRATSKLGAITAAAGASAGLGGWEPGAEGIADAGAEVVACSIAARSCIFVYQPTPNAAAITAAPAATSQTIVRDIKLPTVRRLSYWYRALVTPNDTMPAPGRKLPD